MDVDVSFITLGVTLFNIALVGLSTYAIVLLIKALKIYIKKNSD